MKDTLPTRHNTCINRLRFRYIEFLEEQRTTDERNHKLLEALDRVDNSLALMTARTDRLNSLRKHYEAYLRRICTVHTDGVNDISGQQSDKNMRTEQRNSLPPEAKSTLPLQSSWSNYQPTDSSLSVDLKTPSQQINNDQSVLQTYPKRLQHDFEQLPTFHLSSPVFQQRQTYDNNVRFEVRDFQTDPKLQSLYANTNTQRPMPHLSMPYYINGNKPLDMSQIQTPESILQYPVNPPRMQSFPLQQSNKIPSDHLPREMKNGNFQNAPKSMNRNMSDTPSLNTSLNLNANPYANYRNYSFNNNGQDKNYITDAFPRYTSHVNARQLSKGTKQTHTEEDEDKVSMTTDSEFDRYIDRIRKLHHDLDKQSYEEDCYRQVANSDSSNATVSNNYSETSTRDKLDESLTNKVKQVLELAENLVSRTMNMNGTKCVEQAEQKDHELRRTMQSCTPISERNRVEISDAHEGHITSMPHAKVRISNDIALHEPELDSHQNIENSENQNFACIDGAQEQREQCLPELQIEDSIHSSQNNRTYIADQSELEQCLFSVSQELEPWNLYSVEKQIKEIDLTNDTQDQTVEKDLIVEKPASDENKVMQIESHNGGIQLDKHEARDSEPVQEETLNDTNGMLQSQNNEYFEVSETKDEDNEIFASELRASKKEDASSLNTENRLQNVELPNTQNTSYNVELSNTEHIFENAELADSKYIEQKDYDGNNDEKYNESNDQLDINEDNEPTDITLDEERSNQDYKESDQAKEYSNLNEEYNYDQNESYEYDKKEEYEGYANQEYPEETNEQYEGYTSEQYDQYINNPENTYENDPNVQYQEDTNQKYSSTYNKQYDSNEEFVADENQQYESKEEEIPQEREHETKQEGSEEYTEHQEDSENQGKEVILEKVDEDQSEKLPSTNEKKKGKDVIKSLLDTDTDSTLEQNISTTESDFDFN
ncbi:uncharacterized protein LOC143354163 isoform X2 [Halictus rubicundus]|uniref:uncharacterized protein LOC143354163 isoform X2 n=1 Tax=Halictus rubicundus TaxID=77578 RepID=UPI004036C6BC